MWDSWRRFYYCNVIETDANYICSVFSIRNACYTHCSMDFLQFSGKSYCSFRHQLSARRTRKWTGCFVYAFTLAPEYIMANGKKGRQCESIYKQIHWDQINHYWCVDCMKTSLSVRCFLSFAFLNLFTAVVVGGGSGAAELKIGNWTNMPKNMFRWNPHRSLVKSVDSEGIKKGKKAARSK